MDPQMRPAAKLTGELKTIMFNEGKRQEKSREKNVLEKTFQPFLFQCHNGGGF